MQATVGMMDLGSGVSDPVELRRLNFQTPGMMSHPPIPIMDLAAHIGKFTKPKTTKARWTQD